jgi:hypothetical protein
VSAELVICGDFAVGVGGEFERECAKELRDNLPDGYVIATNVYLPRGGGGEFYECDTIVSAPGVCDILEMKCIRSNLTVWEDLITTETGFAVDRVFSILDSKAKVLSSRRQKSPFPTANQHRSVKIHSQVVVPSDARITFKVPSHSQSKPVRTLAETVTQYQRIASSSPQFRDPVARRENLSAWTAYRNESSKGQRKTQRNLGRFVIRREIRRHNGVFEYFAVDEPPCQMEVQLREFPYDPALPSSQLQGYLRAVARESGVLMKLRHPYIACVIGHFQTGASWVQVSDWFEGERLEDSWPLVADTSVWDKLGIFLKLLKALQFCHEKGVFHRNISADVVRVTSDCSDVRLMGFDCALDLGGTSTTNKAALNTRDSHLIPPEDLQAGRTTNPRLSDIFQTGLLLYRLLENGRWPFDNTFEYVTSGGVLRPFSDPAKDQETEILRTTAVRMLDPQPGNRPDLLSKVEQELHRFLS